MLVNLGTKLNRTVAALEKYKKDIKSRKAA